MPWQEIAVNQLRQLHVCKLWTGCQRLVYWNDKYWVTFADREYICSKIIVRQKWFSIVGLSFFCLICSGFDSEQAPKILTWCLTEQWNTCYKLPKYNRQTVEHVKVFVYLHHNIWHFQTVMVIIIRELYYNFISIFFFFCETSKNWVGRTMRNIKISGDGLMPHKK